MVLTSTESRSPTPVPRERALLIRDAAWAIAIFVVGCLWLGWNIEINGWGNPYYAAAIQSGAAHPINLLFGSADLGGGMTLDKPPLSTWIAVPFVWAFGLGSWQVLIPYVAAGSATSVACFAIARTYTGRGWAALASLFVLVVPVHVSMSRVNNPDVVFELLATLAVLAALRGPSASRAAILSGALVGAAILTKQLQVLIVVPGVAAALLSRTGGAGRRLRRLGLAALSAVLVFGAWAAAVVLTPPEDRPWIGGTQTNSFLELTLGYNGVGRLTGSTTEGALRDLGANDAGILRLITVNFAPELLAFLLSGLLGIVLVMLEIARRAHVPSAIWSASAWFVSGFVVLSFMTGDIHPYYLSCLAPPAALVSSWAIQAIASRATATVGARAATAAAVMLMATLLVGWTSFWYPEPWDWLGRLSYGSAALALVGLFLPRAFRRWGAVASAAAIAIILVVPSAAFDMATKSTPQQGSFFLSGPVPSVESFHRRDAEQALHHETLKMSQSRGEGVSPDVVRFLENAPPRRWAALTLGGQNAATYQLALGKPVMAIGGFNGADNYPTQPDIESWAASGAVRYFIHRQGILDWAPVSDRNRQLVAWIVENFTETDIDGVRLFDLSERTK